MNDELNMHVVEGLELYVVVLDTLVGLLPVTGVGRQIPYADALTQAVREGIITEPGKYGIHIDFDTNTYTIYGLTDPPE